MHMSADPRPMKYVYLVMLNIVNIAVTSRWIINTRSLHSVSCEKQVKKSLDTRNVAFDHPKWYTVCLNRMRTRGLAHRT